MFKVEQRALMSLTYNIMTRFILKTDNRQGEYLKPKYNGKDAPNGWNHFIHSKRAKVEEYAQKNNIIGRIEKIVL